MINFTRNPKLYFIPALIVGLTVMFFGCEGPAGETGPAGSEGLQGLPGADANETCKVCHNDGDEPIKVRQIQWAASTHATGGNFIRNDTDCAPCHTSQGFLEVVATGDDTTVVAIANPAPQNCRTCHTIHTNYDATDWANTKTTAVAPMIAPAASIDIGKGNLCAQCHQPRVPEQGIPAIDAATDALYTPVAADSVDSKYWGIHYGLQGTVLAGVGGWRYDGTAGYTDDAHTTMVTDGCVTCHMADPPYAGNVGGHTMNVSYTYHGSAKFNLNGCSGGTCHTVGTEA
ncbi:MAG: hypothetical protein J3T61_09720, partial [Candidatus Brocadiales bacterium]|nr:hypothetical protein [Candidatus Bathyanammoxibius sp.]